MATKIVADQPEARAKALSHAACEITAIAQTLNIARSHRGVDCFEDLLPGTLKRIELLGTCVGVLADARTDGEEVLAQYAMVLGEKWEVSRD